MALSQDVLTTFYGGQRCTDKLAMHFMTFGSINIPLLVFFCSIFLFWGVACFRIGLPDNVDCRMCSVIDSIKDINARRTHTQKATGLKLPPPPEAPQPYWYNLCLYRAYSYQSLQ